MRDEKFEVQGLYGALYVLSGSQGAVGLSLLHPSSFAQPNLLRGASPDVPADGHLT